MFWATAGLMTISLPRTWLYNSKSVWHFLRREWYEKQKICNNMASTRPWHEYAILHDHETWTTNEVFGKPHFWYITGHVELFSNIWIFSKFSFCKIYKPHRREMKIIYHRSFFSQDFLPVKVFSYFSLKFLINKLFNQVQHNHVFGWHHNFF